MFHLAIMKTQLMKNFAKSVNAFKKVKFNFPLPLHGNKR